MSYFNYHGKVKKLIAENKLVSYELVDEYNGISPALVLYFKDSKPMPIREHMIDEYLALIEKN